MRVIHAIITVDEQRRAVVQLTPDIEPGVHEVVIVVEDASSKAGSQSPLFFSAHDVGPWPEGLSLRREDLYDDRGSGA